MTIRQSIDNQFLKLDLSKLSRRSSDDLHAAKSLAIYGWANRAKAELTKKVQKG